MEFRVLGRLDVLGIDGRIELRGAKRRALVGLLLAERGRVVSADRVVRYLWHDDPRALGRVKSSIHELRKLFGADGDRLSTASGGYSLRVASGELDASVFEALVAQAATTGERERAAGLLSEAVSLWRGAAFEEFADTEWAAGEASRLDTLRLRALENLVDAEFDVGHHAQAVDRLQRLVVDHPLREHFWGQLIVALYRCGRQAEALRAFRQVRAVLAEELGLSPSPALIDLERRVLDHDPTLAWSAQRSDEDRGDLAGTNHVGEVVSPVGTVTFMFSDIAGSTRLWEEHPALMPEVLSRHDEIVTSAVKSGGGFIFSWAGDGMAAAFQRAVNALDAAIETQRRLHSEPWPAPITLRVRMAIHTGETQERAGNYFGPPVNRAARLLALAEGGQIVVSRATADVMGHHPQSELVSIGEHSLRGVPGTMQVFRVAAPGLADVVPAELHADRSGEDAELLPGVLARARDSSRLVGREADLEQLMSVWSDAATGRSRTVIIGGEAGIGKTRLVAEVALEVQSGGGHVLFAGCHENDPLPFGPFAELIDHVAGVGSDRRSISGPEGADAAAEQARVVRLLRDHVVDRGRRQPTLVVVEDVHWASPSTRRALLGLVHHAERCRLLVAVTSRTGVADVSDDVSVMLGEIDKAPGTVRIELHGLSVDDIGAIADTRHHDVNPERVRAETGGNPLLVWEVLEDPDHHSGSSVQALLLSRSKRLSDEDNDLLDAAATVGDEFDIAVLADSVGADLGDVVDAMARCESVGLVDARSSRPGHFGFVHALFRSVRLDALPASRRLQLHHRVALALARLPASRRTLPALARHACAAAPLGDLGYAVDCAMRAGDVVMAELAMDEAAELYRLGLDLTEIIEPPPVVVRCELLVRLGQALLELDDPTSPTILFDAAETAFDLGRPDIVADAMWVIAQTRSVFGQEPELMRLVQRALDVAGPDEVAVRARLMCVLSLQATGLDDPERRHELMAGAIDLARAAGQPGLLMQVLSQHAYSAFHPDNVEARRVIADELLTLARREHRPYFEIYAHDACCIGLLELGDLSAAETEAAEIERIVVDRGNDVARAGILFRRAGFEYVHGDLRAAEATATELFMLVRDRRSTRPNAELLYGVHFMNLRLVQGRIHEVLPMIAAAAAAQPDILPYQAVWSMMSARSGEHDQAREILARVVGNGVEAIPPDMSWYSTLSALGDAAHVVGDTGSARVVADALEPYAGRYVVQSSSVSQPIDVIRAELALTLGEPARAGEIAAGAVAHARSQDAPIFAARALVLEAAARRRLDQHDAAQMALHEAVGIAERTGAQLITLEARRLGLT